MKKIFLVPAVAMVILFSSCHSFKKAPDGLEYKIFSDGSGNKMLDGNFFELRSHVEYKDAHIDTVLQSSDKTGTEIGMLDAKSISPGYYKILSQTRANDSVVIRISTDTLLKNSQGQAPPFFKKGEYIVLTYKVLNIFTDKSQADSAYAVQNAIRKAKDSVARAAQLSIDTKIIADYLAAKNITAAKGQEGTFVVINKQGTGPLIDTSVDAEVNYTGKSFDDGVAFDSNIDPAFGHPGTPIPVKMWAPNVIPGWIDGLKLLSKGAKATFYIPSSLAYGPQEKGNGKIKANENLVFDIEVVDVLPKAAAEAKEAIEQKKMELMRQHYMDSVKNAQGSSTPH